MQALHLSFFLHIPILYRSYMHRMDGRIYRMLINGELIDKSGRFDVINPATGTAFAKAPCATMTDISSAIDAAKEGFKKWKSVALEDRSQAILRAANIIEANRADLELLLSREQGKPLASAVAETSTAISMFRQASDVAMRGNPVKHVKETPTHILQVHHKPLGVVVGITPWNYPLSLGCGKVSRAISHGNSIILKPSPFTPLTSLYLGELLKDVFPPGVFNVLTGADLSGEEKSLGQLLVESAHVNLVSFTGSVATGKRIMAACAANMTRVLLELGGNDPAIVLEDADLAHAVKGIYNIAMSNSGQICCAIKRVYVHDKIFDEFLIQISQVARDNVFSIGPSTMTGMKMGPLNNGLQRKRVIELVDDAVAHGGKIVAGGQIPSHVDPNGFFYEPTIITGITEGVRLVDEEQFGPVIPIMSFSSEEEVIDRANNSRYGLGASVWGRDPVVLNRILSNLEAGIVWANEHAVLREGAPFGGMKNSGFRREGDFAESDLDAYTEVQTVKFSK